MTAQKPLAQQIADLQPALLKYARTACPNVEAAKDLVQETICKALTNAHTFQEGRDLGAWLFGILKNTLINQARDAKPLVRLVEHEHPHSAAPTLPFAGEMDADVLRTAMASLRQIYADVLLLKVQGYGVSEIATLLDLSSNAVSFRLHKARKLMCKDPRVRELAKNCCK